MALEGRRYTQVAMWLHWSVAGLILFNLVIGWFMEGFPAPYRSAVVGLHISSGITVLALTLFRILWRATHRPPPFAADFAPAERWLAHAVHVALYAAMIALPLTGWTIISAHPPRGSAGAAAQETAATHTGAPPRRGRDAHYVWGVVRLPMLAPVAQVGRSVEGAARQHRLHDDAVTWHGTGGYVLLALLLLHVVGAIKHELFDGGGELRRMGVRFPERDT